MKKNTWLRVDGHSEIFVGQYIVPNFVSNSVAIKLSDSEFIVVSPGEPLLEEFLAKYSADVKIHVIMPNAYHYMGVSAWQAAFSDVSLYASKAAIKTLVKKGVAENEGGIFSIENNPPPLPDNYSFLFPPGHRAGDVWLKKQLTNDESLWITCDSFLNYERLSNQPIAKMMQKVLNAAPGLKISQVVKWFILSDKKEFKRWALKRLEIDNPTVLMPSHGEIAQGASLKNNLVSLILTRL